ncbi:MAG: sulfite exporter TauE/SafE family protein [Pirellulales bacterium]
MLESITPYLWLSLSALAAGAINAIAGGGTILTFPALMAALAGNPAGAVIANATSTVALVPGSLAGAWAFRREMQAAKPWLILLFVPSLVGGYIGSMLVTQLNPKYFATLVPWLILTAAVLFSVQPMLTRRLKTAEAAPPTLRSKVAIVCFQLLVAIYGGYFGAGIGILMLGALGLMRMGEINQMNAVKNVLACGINGVSVAIFAWSGKVEWRYAAPMAVSAIIGAYMGGRFSRRLPSRVVRLIVTAIGFSLAAYYFYKQFALPPQPAPTPTVQAAARYLEELRRVGQAAIDCPLL